MNISLYVPGESWLHRLDARTKVLCLLGFFILSLLFSDPRYLAAMTLGILGLMASARVLATARKLWILLVLLVVYSTVLWPLFVTGRTPIVQIGSLMITSEAVRYGLGIGLRLNVMILSGLLLLSSTPIEAFTRALQRLGLPAPMASALSLAFRWVPTLMAAAGLIVQAQQSRGLNLAEGSFLTRIRRYPPLLVPLVGHTLRQTRLLAMALESKGFGPTVRRHPMFVGRLGPGDYTSLAMMGVLLIASLWLRWSGHGVITVGF